MIDRQHPLPVTPQCQLLALARSSVYAAPRRKGHLCRKEARRAKEVAGPYWLVS